MVSISLDINFIHGEVHEPQVVEEQWFLGFSLYDVHMTGSYLYLN